MRDGITMHDFDGRSAHRTDERLANNGLLRAPKRARAEAVAFSRAATLIVCLLVMSALAFSQTTAPQASPTQPDPKAVPTIDGGIGPCTADFTITDANGAPVYAAKIKVHIAYRWLNIHKLDLELGTNIDGKARFTGLPDRIKHGIYFYASEGNRSGEAFDDPANNCKAQFGITLREKDTLPSTAPGRM